MSKSMYDCLCCGLPTLSDVGMHDICEVCWWEDEIVKFPPDFVSLGPNWPYSLSEARRNFLNHGHMYKIDHGFAVTDNPSESRVRLVKYALDVANNKISLNQDDFWILLDASES